MIRVVVLDVTSQIEKAHADRNEVPELCRLLLTQSVVIIGSWADAEGNQLLIQDFRLQGQRFIPLFSDEAQFWSQLSTTPFSSKGLTLECKSFIALLHGDELLILNPGSLAPVHLMRGDFQPFL